MHPALFSLQLETLHRLDSYNFFIYVAIALCAVGLALEMERDHWAVPPVPFFLRWLPDSLQGSVWFAASWIAASYLFVGVVGAQVLSGISYTPWTSGLPLERLWDMFLANMSGLVWYGAFVSSLLWTFYIARACKVSWLKFVDIGVILVALGHVPARIGCYLGGCCFGSPTDLPWGIAYDSALFRQQFRPGTRVHPSQFYELVVALVLVIYLRRVQLRRKFIGETTMQYLVWGGLTRFLTEIVRADTPKGVIWPWLSVSQVIAFVMVVIGCAMYVRMSPRLSR